MGSATCTRVIVEKNGGLKFQFGKIELEFDSAEQARGASRESTDPRLLLVAAALQKGTDPASLAVVEGKSLTLDISPAKVLADVEAAAVAEVG